MRRVARVFVACVGLIVVVGCGDRANHAGPGSTGAAGSVLMAEPRNVHPDDWIGLSARRDNVAERLCASFVYGSGETFEYCRSFAEANSDSFGSAIPTSGKGRPGERAMLALVGRTDEEVRDVYFLPDVARLARVTTGPNAVIVTVADSVEMSAVAMVVGPSGTRYCLLTPQRQAGPGCLSTPFTHYTTIVRP